VIARARDRFLVQGYAATSTRQIAADAEVTERTLFNIVPTKSDLLREVLKTYVFDQEYGPLLQRSDYAPILASDSPEAFLTAYTRWVVQLHGHTSAIAEMCRAAAGVDPGAAQIWRWGNDQQIIDLIDLAKWLRQRGWLRADTTPAEAGRSLAVLSGHETYWRLVSEQHWSTTRYRRWLHRHCALELTSSGQQT
jgi:AcrR family transcriptional regulator